MEKQNLGSLLKKLNEKTNQTWSLNKIKSLAKGFSAQDITDESKMKDLIKKVGNSLGLKLSNDKIKQVQNKLQKKLKK